jgi:hypothetical protein
VEALLERTKAVLPPEDYEIIKAMADTIYILSQSVDKKAASIQWLLGMIFGAATEKLEKAEQEKKSGASGNKPKKGHGRNPASDYTGAEKVEVDHDTLKPGDNCPTCLKGKAYEIKEPKKVVRITGNAPLSATVYEMQRLRCNLCGDIFTADTPEGVGDAKYEPSAGVYQWKNCIIASLYSFIALIAYWPNDECSGEVGWSETEARVAAGMLC